jgi:phospholipid transport system substrate-binding protein
MKFLYTMTVGAMLASGFASGEALAVTEAPADPATVAAAKSDDPGKLIQTAAEGMLKDLEANRDSYRKDPAKLNALIEKYLLPNFDSQYSARLVLGKHWRDASEDQRKRFVDAFYHSLVKNYGTALVEFTSDRMKILPAQVDAKGESATVRTEIKRSNGTRIPVNYTLRKTPDGWKAWDVVIEGISYVKSFREDFGAEIDQKGLDAVIQRIEKGGTPSAPGKA